MLLLEIYKLQYTLDKIHLSINISSKYIKSIKDIPLESLLNENIDEENSKKLEYVFTIFGIDKEIYSVYFKTDSLIRGKDIINKMLKSFTNINVSI